MTTREGIRPARRARHSVRKQTTKWTHTIQTSTARTSITRPGLTSAVSHSVDGASVGSGLPTPSTSATGTPTSRSSDPRIDSTAVRVAAGLGSVMAGQRVACPAGRARLAGRRTTHALHLEVIGRAGSCPRGDVS